MLPLRDFGNAEQDMLPDKIVEQVYNGHVCERLLLNKAIQIANQVESAAHDASTFSNSEVPVREISKPPKKGGGRSHSSGGLRKGEAQSAHTCKCYRCDSNKHLANSTKCPATNKICKSCGKTGHFAKVCRSGQKHEVREVVIPELIVLFLQDAAPVEKRIMCKVELGTSPNIQPWDMIVDTGSSVSILPAHVYEYTFSHIPRRKAETPLVTYSRQRIPVLGILDRQVHHDGHSAPASFYIVKSGSLLLGLGLTKALDIAIRGNRVVLKAEQEVREISVPPPVPHPPLAPKSKSEMM